MPEEDKMELHYAAFSIHGSKRWSGALRAVDYDAAAEALAAMFDIRLDPDTGAPAFWISRTDRDRKDGCHPWRVRLYLAVYPLSTAGGRERVRALDKAAADERATRAAERVADADADRIAALIGSMPAAEVIARLTASPALPPVLVPQAGDGAQKTRCTGNDGATPCAVTAPYLCANCPAPQT